LEQIVLKTALKFGLVKSPLNYIGGKFKLLPQILPLFPQYIDCFVDLFAGGCNVGVNVESESVVCNDNISYLIDFYNVLKSNNKERIINHIERRILEFSLTEENEGGYKVLRSLYNVDRNPLDLFVLTAYSFNHQIRFNSKHEFNNPFGRNRSSFNSSMRGNLDSFIDRLHNIDIRFTSKNFDDFDFCNLTNNDFVYCDPPYLITSGTYNDGKRGFTGWNDFQERKLLSILSQIDKAGIRFALSNVIEHKGLKNNILISWIKENHYNVNYLNKDYSNSNYQTKDIDKGPSIEVLVTNYNSYRLF